MIDQKILDKIIRLVGSPANINIDANVLISGVGYVFRTDGDVRSQVKYKSLNEYKNYWKEVIDGANKKLFGNYPFTHKNAMLNRINNFMVNPFKETYTDDYCNTRYRVNAAQVLNKARDYDTTADAIIVAANRDIASNSQGNNGVKTLKNNTRYAREIVVISMGNYRIYSKKDTPNIFDTIDKHT